MLCNNSFQSLRMFCLQMQNEMEVAASNANFPFLMGSARVKVLSRSRQCIKPVKLQLALWCVGTSVWFNQQSRQGNLASGKRFLRRANVQNVEKIIYYLAPMEQHGSSDTNPLIYHVNVLWCCRL